MAGLNRRNRSVVGPSPYLCRERSLQDALADTENDMSETLTPADLDAAPPRRLPVKGLVIGAIVIASAAVHLAGFTDASPPAIIVAGAQVIIGASVGARFSGLTFRDLGRIIRIGGIATVLLLIITAGSPSASPSLPVFRSVR